MREVTTEHFVPAKTYTKSKYIAEDGTEFDFKDACLRYEARLRVENHPVFKSRIKEVWTCGYEYSASLFYISSDDDFDFLKENMSRGDWHSDYTTYGAGWYIYYCVDGGDYADDLYLYNYLNYEEEMERDFFAWKSDMRKYIGEN